MKTPSKNPDGPIPTAAGHNSLRDAIDSSLQCDRDAYNRALKDGQ